MARKSPLVIGLDVGTYKIGVIVAEVAEGGVEVVGIGTAASRGLRKGVVVTIEKTVEAIRRAVEEAELMAACEIRSVIAGSAGSHIKGFNSHGVVAVRSREVASGDVERVVDAARAVALPTDQEVLHVLPQEFIVDDQDGIREPAGMAGVRLQARVHIVPGPASAETCRGADGGARRGRAPPAGRGWGGRGRAGARRPTSRAAPSPR